MVSTARSSRSHQGTGPRSHPRRVTMKVHPIDQPDARDCAQARDFVPRILYLRAYDEVSSLTGLADPSAMGASSEVAGFSASTTSDETVVASSSRGPSETIFVTVTWRTSATLSEAYITRREGKCPVRTNCQQTHRSSTSPKAKMMKSSVRDTTPTSISRRTAL